MQHPRVWCLGLLVCASLLAREAVATPAQAADVRTPPARAAQQAPPRTPGLAATDAIGADRWHTAGFTGYGVRVAIVDAGFRDVEPQLGVTLPLDAHLRSFRTDGDIHANDNHGTLAARIVAEIAPQAELYLLNFQTVADLSALVDYTIAEHIQVVSFSLGFPQDGAGNGTGPVNDIVSRGVAAGQLWSVAAGNWAQQHWSGTFTDRNNNGIHEFAQGIEEETRSYEEGDLMTVSLRWDDPWGKACNDYDLEVFGPDGALVKASRGIQDCKQNPTESVQVLLRQAGRYRARVVSVGAQARRLDVLMLGSPDRGDGVDIPVPGGSLAQPADNAGVLTVGAVNPFTPAQLGRTSSRGPTTDGRAKPDLVSVTGVGAAGLDTAFGGTSAAAPHVAGAAALLIEALPQADVRELVAQLRSRATRLPAPALASEVGAGALNLGTLAGLGPTLPANAGAAMLEDISPAGHPGTVFQYHGPAGYPTRFFYRLTPGRTPRAIFRLSLTTLRFDAFIWRAPAAASSFDAVTENDLLWITFQD